jgi:hypothetical protein
MGVESLCSAVPVELMTSTSVIDSAVGNVCRFRFTDLLGERAKDVALGPFRLA